MCVCVCVQAEPVEVKQEPESELQEEEVACLPTAILYNDTHTLAHPAVRTHHHTHSTGCSFIRGDINPQAPLICSQMLYHEATAIPW